MSDFEYRLKNELSELGFNWDEHKISNTFSQTKKNMSTARCAISLEHINNNGEIVKDILFFEFGVSLKESQEKPIVDSMVATLGRYPFSAEKPVILMRQAFHTDWGILPSRQCILQRASDYQLPAKMLPKTDASLEERLMVEFDNLSFNFEKMEIFLSSDDTYFGHTTSLEHISTQSDQLVIILKCHQI